jgi:hypothetical protein
MPIDWCSMMWRLVNVQPRSIAPEQHGDRARFAVDLRLHDEQSRNRRIRHEGRQPADDPALAVTRGDNLRLAGGFRILRHRLVVAPGLQGRIIARDQRQVETVITFELRHPARALRVVHHVVRATRQQRRFTQHHRKVNVASGDFLEQYALGQQVGARAARIFRQRQAAQAHLRQLIEKARHQRLFKGFEPFRIDRRGLDFAVDKIADGIAEFELLRRQFEIVHSVFSCLSC